MGLIIFTEIDSGYKTKKFCLNSVLLLFSYFVAAVYHRVNCNEKEREKKRLE